MTEHSLCASSWDSRASAAGKQLMNTPISFSLCALALCSSCLEVFKQLMNMRANNPREHLSMTLALDVLSSWALCDSFQYAIVHGWSVFCVSLCFWAIKSWWGLQLIYRDLCITQKTKLDQTFNDPKTFKGLTKWLWLVATFTCHKEFFAAVAYN